MLLALVALAGGLALGERFGVLPALVYFALALTVSGWLARGLGNEFRTLSRRLAQSEDNVRENVAQIERIETVRRELVAHVSHDLRTPLAALRGYLDTLILKNGTLSTAQRNKYLAIAQRHSERLSKLVDELFELSKLESPETELHREPFSVAELVQDNVQGYQIQAGQRGVDLTAELQPDLPMVVADLGMIERVLENLLENALRFTPAPGSVAVKLGHDEARGQVQVCVADTGCGIAEAEHEHIFERYYQVPQPTRTGAGSGLGLAIAKRILELHDSSISVESTPGAGSIFSFSLAVASPGPHESLSRSEHRRPIGQQTLAAPRGARRSPRPT